MTTKVKTVEQYIDGQGSHTVCKVKLVLVECKLEESLLIKVIEDTPYVCIGGLPDHLEGKIEHYKGKIFSSKGWTFFNKKYFQPVKPILVSEIEKLEVGDPYVSKNSKYFGGHWHIGIADEFISKFVCEVYKILVQPEQFSSKHLKSIIDGKFKEGTLSYLKVEKSLDPENITIYGEWNVALHLPEPGHVKLFKVIDEQEKIYSTHDVKYMLCMAVAHPQITAKEMEDKVNEVLNDYKRTTPQF